MADLVFDRLDDEEITQEEVDFLDDFIREKGIFASLENSRIYFIDFECIEGLITKLNTIIRKCFFKGLLTDYETDTFSVYTLVHHLLIYHYLPKYHYQVYKKP